MQLHSPKHLYGVTQICRSVELNKKRGALRKQHKEAWDTLLHYFGLYVILLADSSMKVRGVRVQGHDEMAMKLLFWELEQHLKR